MHKTYILLGSNLGNSRQQLVKASRFIEQNIGKISRCSNIYLTAAWGFSNQPDFLNQVIIVETSLDAPGLMKSLLAIEKQMGRIRSKKNAPRIIDLDILFFDKKIIDQKNLQVPHPRIAERRFVLIPLNELSPNLVHPVLGLTVHQLLKKCMDDLDVKKF